MSDEFTEQFFRRVYIAIMPEGKIWEAEYEADFDKFLAALSISKVDLAQFLAGLSATRLPASTKLLDDLEQEFGILPLSSWTEEKRRENLSESIQHTWDLKTAEDMESALRAVGFDVYVHVNDPPVDPEKFLFEAFVAICGSPTAYCGGPEAYCGGIGGYLLVNGELIFDQILYTTYCGASNALCGSDQAYCGSFSGVEQDIKQYDIPTDPGYWKLFFFVGGPATRDIDGYLETIEEAPIPYNRRYEFRDLVLKYKPVHAWGGLIIRYTAYE